MIIIRAIDPNSIENIPEMMKFVSFCFVYYFFCVFVIEGKGGGGGVGRRCSGQEKEGLEWRRACLIVVNRNWHGMCTGPVGRPAELRSRNERATTMRLKIKTPSERRCGQLAIHKWKHRHGRQTGPRKIREDSRAGLVVLEATVEEYRK